MVKQLQLPIFYSEEERRITENLEKSERTFRKSKRNSTD